MIFYFTATGNSLYVAKKLSENPISIPQVKQGSSFEDDVIGIVSPVYCGEIPKARYRNKNITLNEIIDSNNQRKD